MIFDSNIYKFEDLNEKDKAFYKGYERAISDIGCFESDIHTGIEALDEIIHQLEEEITSQLATNLECQLQEFLVSALDSYEG